MTFENLIADLHIFYCQYFDQVDVSAYQNSVGVECISVQGDRVINGKTTVYSFSMFRGAAEYQRKDGTLEDFLKEHLSDLFKEKDIRDYMRNMKGVH